MNERDEAGKLLPGHSVVPKRRSGKGGGIAVEVAKYLDPHRKEVLDTLARLAKAGDPRSMTEYLNRTVGIVRPEEEHVTIPGLADAKSLSDKAGLVLESIANGKVSVTAGLKLMSALDIVTRTFALEEIDARIAALEGRRIEAIEA